MDEPLSSLSEQEHSVSYSSARLAWPTLLALAWLVYEITRQPTLAAVLACAKFGWNDYLTARWLRRADPQRGRGRTCFWFYLALGLWKVMATSLVVMFAGVWADQAVRALLRLPGPQGPPLAFLASLLEAVVMLGLLTLSTVVAVGLALHYRVKVWVDSRVHQARRANLWPPSGEGPNRAGCLLLTALIPAVVVALVVTFGVLVNAVGPVGGGLIAVGCPLVLFASATAVLDTVDRLGRRIVAGSPWECWGEPASAPAPMNPEASQP